MTPFAVADEERVAALRRMKLFAAGLLVAAAVIYVLARAWEQSDDAPTLAGYVRAAAEAAMVGGIADWFAVTALFRHPLGLPIPHTAIIPTHKDRIGHTLGDFVGANFLSADAVRQRLASAEVGRRLGTWLARTDNAERVAGELANAAKAGIELLRDDDVQPVLEQLVERRLADLHVSPSLGRTLDQVVRDGAHRGLVDLLARSAYDWLFANRDLIMRVVSQQAPTWSPRFIDERVATRIYSELLRVAGDVVRHPQHPAREAIDQWLSRLADDLQHDPATQARVDSAVQSLAAGGQSREVVADLVAAARKALVEMIDDPESELRVRIREALVRWGERLATEPDIAAKVDGWLERAAVYVVTGYRHEITRLVTDTVERWDAQETSRRIEVQVGRDLQFIRINGTVVGAIVGVLIHAVSQLL